MSGSGDDERFADWVDGRLSRRELAKFEAEMAAYPAVKQAAEDYQERVEQVRQALASPLTEQEGGPADLTDRIMAACGGAAGRAPAGGPSKGPRPVANGSSAPKRWMPLLLSGAAAATLLGGVWFLQNLGSGPVERRDTAGIPLDSGIAENGPSVTDPSSEVHSVTGPVAEGLSPMPSAPDEGPLAPGSAGMPEAPVMDRQGADDRSRRRVDGRSDTVLVPGDVMAPGDVQVPGDALGPNGAPVANGSKSGTADPAGATVPGPAGKGPTEKGPGAGGEFSMGGRGGSVTPGSRPNPTQAKGSGALEESMEFSARGGRGAPKGDVEKAEGDAEDGSKGPLLRKAPGRGAPRGAPSPEMERSVGIVADVPPSRRLEQRLRTLDPSQVLLDLPPVRTIDSEQTPVILLPLPTGADAQDAVARLFSGNMDKVLAEAEVPEPFRAPLNLSFVTPAAVGTATDAAAEGRLMEPGAVPRALLLSGLVTPKQAPTARVFGVSGSRDEQRVLIGQLNAWAVRNKTAVRASQIPTAAVATLRGIDSMETQLRAAAWSYSVGGFDRSVRGYTGPGDVVPPQPGEDLVASALPREAEAARLEARQQAAAPSGDPVELLVVFVRELPEPQPESPGTGGTPSAADPRRDGK